MYNRLRKDYATKARENHNRGLSAVATYYASEVNAEWINILTS